MIGVVTIEPVILEVEFIRFLEVQFELRPGLVTIFKPIPLEDSGWEEACELDGCQCFVGYLLNYVGRQLQNELYITIIKAINNKFDLFIGIPTLGPMTFHGRLFHWYHTAVIGS